MRVKSPRSRRSTALAASVAALLTVGIGNSLLPAADATAETVKDKPRPADAAGSASTEDKGAYDARTAATSTGKAVVAKAVAKASSRPPTAALREKLGGQAVVDMDGLTGTVRQLARLDGFLSGKSSAPARLVAMNYVRANAAALGLTAADFGTFSLRRDYVDIVGTHHLSWTQSAGGTPVFGNGLKVSVTKDGRVLTVGGSPVSGLTAPRTAATEVASSKAAIGASRTDMGEPSTAGADDSAKPVLFLTAAGVRKGWETITMSAERPMLSVIDAATGRALFRQDLGSEARSNGTAVRTPVTWNVPDPKSQTVTAKPVKRKPKYARALAFTYFPKAKHGGRPVPVNYTNRGWLKANAKVLAGNNAHVWADTVDDDRPAKAEQIRPRTPGNWRYRMTPFHMKRYSFCDNPYPCSWNPNKPFSWRTNRNQNATQVFYFVNNWHDHLLAKPIGFTEAAGNFERINHTGKGKGRDAVRTQTDDGANSGGTGLPDGNHVDNANMNTPPDGHAPTMQMYLQHQPFTSYPGGDPFSPTNVGDEADTVYHEYTHGLSNRLVVDSQGRSTLGGGQAGAMGEAWGDWYAMDYLVAKGNQIDKPGKADVVLFQYDGEGVYYDRYMPIDCKVDDLATRCDDEVNVGHTGGFTYADYGLVNGGPEVHSDGEIWAQTLWDLRDRVGSKVSQMLVTRAMEMAPENPSFIDMRNAILLADQSAYSGSHNAGLWQVFAHRGMGYFAGAVNGDDTEPIADFDTPPTPGGSTGAISGTVTDAATGDPVQGVTVTLVFQGAPSGGATSAITDSDGIYSLGPVPFHDYPKLVFGGAGYEQVVQSINVTGDMNGIDAEVERDWAASAGGASVESFTGPDYGFGCAPENLIDQSAVNGWASDNLAPRTIVIKLPEAVDVSKLTLDPTANCGDGGSASTGSYKIETSSTGAAGSWTTAATGEFVAADLYQDNEIPLTAGDTGVGYVRFTMIDPIVFVDTASYPDGCADGGYSGCDYMDASELRVFGSPIPN